MGQGGKVILFNLREIFPINFILLGARGPFCTDPREDKIYRRWTIFFHFTATPISINVFYMNSLSDFFKSDMMLKKTFGVSHAIHIRIFSVIYARVQQLEGKKSFSDISLFLGS